MSETSCRCLQSRVGGDVTQISQGAGGRGRRAAIAAGGLLAILFVGFIGYIFVGGKLSAIIPAELSAEAIADAIRSWGAWAMVGSMLLMVAHSFVPFPSELIAIANGMVFGLVMGTIITWIGAMLGAILAFALARSFGRRFVEAVLPVRYTATIDRWTEDQGVPILLVSRFLPVVSFNLINYAAGLTSVSWWTFLWTTGLGIAPLTFLMVFIGEEMISGNWKLALFLISAFVAVAMLSYVIMRRK